MKKILYCLLTLATTAAGAAPVATYALVVDSQGSPHTKSGVVHSGQMLPASSELSVPEGAAHVDLQLTGDATYSSDDSSPTTATGPETLVRVEPGSDLSVSKLEATDTGIGTVHQIKLRLDRGSVLVSARRLPEPSSLELLAPAGRVSISEGTVEVTGHSVAVAAGRAVYYPNAADAKTAAPVVLTSGHSYDTHADAVSSLSPAAGFALRHRAEGLHSVGPAHFSDDEDFTEDCISPIHPGDHHGHHPHHPHHPHHGGSSGHGSDGEHDNNTDIGLD